jgi:hypothetical protein
VTFNEEFFDASVRHQIDLLRFGSGVARQVNALLDETRADMRAQVERRLGKVTGITGASLRRLRELERAIDQTRSGAWNDVTESWTRTATDIALDEPLFVGGLLTETLPVELDLVQPSAGTLRALVTTRPFQGKPLKEWAQSAQRADLTRIHQQIRIGMVQGESARDIAARVFGARGAMSITRHQAEAVTRTVINGVSNAAQQEFLRANADLFDVEQYVATLDSRTTILCAGLDGKQFPVGKGPVPPQHVNCLPGYALVSSRGRISAVSKRWHEGYLCIITTASGRVLSCTPNHPVLTDRGWVPAGLVDERCRVVCDLGSERPARAENESEQAPARIEQVARAYSELPGVVFRRAPVSAEDFHGDGSEGEVEIVATDRGLRDEPDATSFDELLEGALQVGHIRPQSLSGPGALHQELFRSGPRGCAVRRLQHPTPLIFGGVSPSPVHLLAHRSPVTGSLPPETTGFSDVSADAVALQKQMNGGCAAPLGEGQLFDRGSITIPTDNSAFIGENVTPERRFATLPRSVLADHAAASEQRVHAADSALLLFAKLLDRSPGEVAFDDVVSVRKESFRGHVYNLETSSGHYVAHGIVVHNCRSIRVAAINGEVIGERPFKARTQQQMLREYSARHGLGKVTSRDDLPRGHKSAFDAFSRRRMRELTGQVPARTTYQEWLKRQPADIQDDILGPARGQLFREGGLTLDRFVGREGDELTLEELRRRNREAWERAGLGGSVADRRIEERRRREAEEDDRRRREQAERLRREADEAERRQREERDRREAAARAEQDRQRQAEEGRRRARERADAQLAGMASQVEFTGPAEWRAPVAAALDRAGAGRMSEIGLPPMTSLRVIAETDKPGAWGYYRPSTMTVVASAPPEQELLGEAHRRSQGGLSTMGEWSTAYLRSNRVDSVVATAVHEFGHHLHFQIRAEARLLARMGDTSRRAKNLLDAETVIADTYRNIVQNDRPQGATGVPTRDPAGRAPTRYARQDYQEFWSEAFAIYHTNRSWLQSNKPESYAMVETVLEKVGLK